MCLLLFSHKGRIWVQEKSTNLGLKAAYDLKKEKKCFQAYFGRKSPRSVAEGRRGFNVFVVVLKSVCTFCIGSLLVRNGDLSYFFPISYEMISNELVIRISGSKYKMKVETMLKYLSHSKVELLYLFKRHTSDFLIQAF